MAIQRFDSPNHPFNERMSDEEMRDVVRKLNDRQSDDRATVGTVADAMGIDPSTVSQTLGEIRWKAQVARRRIAAVGIVVALVLPFGLFSAISASRRPTLLPEGFNMTLSDGWMVLGTYGPDLAVRPDGATRPLTPQEQLMVMVVAKEYSNPSTRR